jgi:hypothetical protein
MAETRGKFFLSTGYQYAAGCQGPKNRFQRPFFFWSPVIRQQIVPEKPADRHRKAHPALILDLGCSRHCGYVVFNTQATQLLHMLCEPLFNLLSDLSVPFP